MNGVAPGTSDLSAPHFLKADRGRVEDALAELIPEVTRGLAPSLVEPVQYALSSTGKRLRPILCVAAYRAARGVADVPHTLHRLSCSLEIVHTYSLVHDDLPCMDDDDLRRGRATVHRVYGTARATLAGAALLPIAMEVLDAEGAALGLQVAERGEIIRELAGAIGARGMVGGQLMDLAGEHRRVHADELEAIHRKKTGALLTCSLRVGARAGRADPELLSALTIYGAAIGLAFQITDDLLDVEGSSAALGKAAGRDLVLKKASYPSLYGVDGARKLARSRIDEAKAALADYDLPLLLRLADYVVERSN